MTTYKQVDPQPKLGSSSHGNAFIQDSKVTPAAALTTSDEVVLFELPAGHRLTGLKYRNGDFDTGAALAVNLGYRSTHPNQEVAASANYFLSASAALQAAQAGWVDIPFDPITFQEPVQIVLKPTVSAAGVSGTPSIYAVAEGQIVGVS